MAADHRKTDRYYAGVTLVNELRTTAIFAIIATGSVILAWLSRPSAILSEGELAAEKRGSVIFPGLEPDKASSFRIVRFNEDLATLSRIELSKDPNSQLWTLPSADGYPADSAEQVSQATTPLVGLTVLSTVSTDRGDHTLYGVIEPNEEELTVSASGVGTLVQVGGAENEILASLIVGKEVEGAENQHYVRVPTEDAVYVVQIDSNAFSTDLEKWIKGEILNVRSFDIEQVGLRDYAILRTERGYGLGRNFDADLEFKDNKWSLVEFVDHSLEGSPTINQPPEGKSLNEPALNDLRSNIQNLKIVNVRRKPLGLAADLKADKSLLENEESTKSLQDQGFFPMESGDVYSAGGELIVGTKDGIRYLLRFGNTRVSGNALESADDAEDEESDGGVTRFLLVTAQLDESKFPPPELKLVPETVEEMLAMEAGDSPPAPEATPDSAEPADVEDASSESNEATPATDSPETDGTSADGAEKPAKENASPASGEPASGEPASSEPSSEPSSSEPASGEPESGEPAGSTESGSSSDPAASEGPETTDSTSRNRSATTEAGISETGYSETPTDHSSLSGKLVATVQDAAAAESASQPESASQSESDQQDESRTELNPSRQETPEELQERLEYLQETIRKENQRLIDDRNEKLNEGRKRVAELNARFADWYYIVSNSVYNRMKISRDQLFVDPQSLTPSGNPPAGFELPNLPSGLQLPTQ
jgi:hypothetical protein